MHISVLSVKRLREREIINSRSVGRNVYNIKIREGDNKNDNLWGYGFGSYSG